jgi:cytochrome c peroxidase
MLPTFVQAENNRLYRLEPITPIPLQVDVNEARASLGERLFHDTRLSRNNSISCSSCHRLADGGDDNLATGISISEGLHVINTSTIFNVSYNFRQNWDGSARTLQEQINMVVTNHLEFDNEWSNIIAKLNMDENIQHDFNAIYADGISKDNIIDALVEFEKTLVTPNSRFDRYLRNENSLTEDEINGYALFKDLGCISCHQGMNIGGNLFQKFGIFYNYIAERGDIKESDQGKFNNSKREEDRYVFKVPSLRNVAVTAPYLHDGSIETLEEAIEIMGRTQLGRSLNDLEIMQIKAFLMTLTGEYKNRPLDVEL